MTTAEEILADWKNKRDNTKRSLDKLQIEISAMDLFISDIQDLVMEQRKVEEGK